jgi:Tol biopolymer transport system component
MDVVRSREGLQMGRAGGAKRVWIPVIVATVVAALALAGGPAEGKVPGANGRIAFGRFAPDIGDFDVYTAEPDGSDQQEIVPGPAECPRWSGDGTQIQVCVVTPAGLIRPAIADADGSGLAVLNVQDPTINLGCWAWSGQGLLACEAWDDANPSRLPGVFTLRSSDGGGLTRLTTNATGSHDVPGDFSPDGSRLVFQRVTDPDAERGTLFVMRTDGTGLRRVSPPRFAGDFGSWSPDGRWIAFNTDSGKLFVVHPDGTGLRQIPVQVPGRAFVFQPGWSPDGTRIVVRAFLTSTGEVALATMAANGTDVQVMSGMDGSEEFADWGAGAG